MNILLEKFSFRNCLIISIILHSLILLSFFFQEKITEIRKNRNRVIAVEIKEDNQEIAEEPPPPPKPSLFPPSPDAVVSTGPIVEVETIDYNKIAKRPELLQPSAGKRRRGCAICSSRSKT